MSCRFPGAPNPLEFWRNNLDARVSLTELDKHRWDHRLLYHPNARTKNHTHTETAGLVESPDLFAARHFGISPRRARWMDPQQRLALELTREALQDAGHDKRAFGREESAVFLGSSVSEFSNLASLKLRSRQLADGQFGDSAGCDVSSAVDDINAYTMSGCLTSMSASGIAQAFRLGGPALTVDAACASALAATVQGINYLRTLPVREGPSPLVIVGGIYLMLNPENSVCFSKTGALGTRECRPFDAQAGGFILGEGGGVFVIKRLQDALCDEDRIYAVIKSAVWNNDGGSDSPMAPSREGQERLLRQGFEQAGMGPEMVGYVECHGTATPAGDVIELAALSSVWDNHTRPRLGSVKANIGHTLPAAGAAGLMRAALALHYKMLPPQAAWKEWHPHLLPYAEQFRIETEAKAWDGPPGATVSSFGFGGTNCFVVLEAAPEFDPISQETSVLLAFAAPDAQLLAEYLESCENSVAHQPLGSLAYTLSLRGPGTMAAFVKAGTTLQAIARMRQCRTVLGRCQGRLVEEENFLLGPSTEIAGKTEGAWTEAAEWAAGVEAKREPQPLAVLPPSPLTRISLWPFDNYLPGPRACQTEWPEQLDHGPLQEAEISLRTHPFLRDHQLRGRSFLPLASALDFMAWHADLTPPFSLSGIEVKRGLMVTPQARIRLHREAEHLELREVRPTGREVVAFKAQVNGGPGAAPQPWMISGEKAALELEEFYRHYTFHGASLAGILGLSHVGDEFMEAQVGTSLPAQWSLIDPRAAWHLDPLTVDSALQVGIYWAQVKRKRGLLPQSIERLEVWRSFQKERVTIQIRMTQEHSKGFTADFLFVEDSKVCAALRGVSAKFADFAPD